jgi:hypothetical protein
MGLGRLTNTYSLTRTCTKPTNKCLVHRWSTFGARTSHGHVRTHKTHNDSNLGKATTFPLIIYYTPLHKAHIQMAFCPKTPKWDPEIPKVGIPTILRPQNFVCRPLIGMRFEKKIVALVEVFPMVCRTPPARKEIRLIPDF